MGVGGTAHRAACDHVYAYHAGNEEGNDDVAVYAMENKELVADDGHKLEADEEAGGHDGNEVEGDADAAVSCGVPKPLTWDGGLGIHVRFEREIERIDG